LQVPCTRVAGGIVEYDYDMTRLPATGLTVPDMAIAHEIEEFLKGFEYGERFFRW